MHYLLFYEVSEDYLARRAEFREAHLEKAWKASERGELLLGGALANPVDGAMVLFHGDSPEVAENFAKVDPYVTNGLVRRWYVREWTTVAGENAATPVKPAGNPPPKFLKGVGNQVWKTTPQQLEKGAILRMWKAQSTSEKEAGYVRHATQNVFPRLREIEGHRGTYLLRRVAVGAIELLVFTLWESMEAVRRFAGATPDKAVIEEQAKANLTSFDDTVMHFEIVHSESAPESS